MKNMPDGPGCAIVSWAAIEIALIVSLVLANTQYLWVYAVASIVLSAFGWVFLWIWITVDDIPTAAELESYEIMNATWSVEHRPAVLDHVSDVVDLGNNESLYRWKPGWSLDRLSREYLQIRDQAYENWKDGLSERK